jgi:hypothetical protein
MQASTLLVLLGVIAFALIEVNDTAVIKPAEGTTKVETP